MSREPAPHPTAAELSKAHKRARSLAKVTGRYKRGTVRRGQDATNGAQCEGDRTLQTGHSGTILFRRSPGRRSWPVVVSSIKSEILMSPSHNVHVGCCSFLPIAKADAIRRNTTKSDPINSAPLPILSLQINALLPPF